MSNRLAVLAANIRAAHEDICRSHQYSAERAVDAGMMLLEAQKQVPKGQWTTWVEAEAGLPARTASRYIRLSCFVTAGTATVADIAETGQEAALQAVVAAAVEAAREDETTIGSPVSSDTCEIADLDTLIASGAKFGCIYADPPWLYDNQATRASTGNHYDGLTVDAICAMPVAQLAADNAHLHLWTTNGFLFDAPRIFAAWGFEFRSSFVWVKRQMGIGNYWRNSHEMLLTGIRGDATRFNDHSMMSWLECDRGAHSEKPGEVRAFIERASPGPYLELFARLPTQGWTVWGNQIERNLFMPMEAAE